MRSFLPVSCAVWSLAAILTAAPGALKAQNLAEALSLDPMNLSFGEVELRITGFGSYSAYSAYMPGPGSSETGLTGQTRSFLRLQRILDTGLIVGVKSTLMLSSDTLSGDAYGNDLVQKFYAYVQSGLGTVELGQTQGASYALGITGPKVSEHVSLDNPDSFFFYDGAGGGRFDSFFRFQTAGDLSRTNAKISYLSPRLLGMQVGVSFTPVSHKSPLPTLANPQDTPNRQDLVWEGAASYTDYFSELAVGLYAAYAHGKRAKGLPGFDNAHDFSVGLQLAYQLSDIKLSAGGGYRVSNTYGFDANRAVQGKDTRLAFVSALMEVSALRIGIEYADGDMNGTAPLPDFGMRATQIAAGYRLNENIQLSAGWQWRDANRSLGTFYTGANAIEMDAGFLTLDLTL
jgi:hypothetical protein